MDVTVAETQVFENNNFLCVDKRPGFLTVPSRWGAQDPRPCELIDWSQKKQIQLWPIHRLDEEVSGVLLFAKTPEAHRTANRWFEHHQIKKTYEALTESAQAPWAPEKMEVWKSYLLRGKKRAYEKPFGKEAITEAVLQSQTASIPSGCSLWRLFPLTGRAHQLRYELSKRALPILGDSLYGSQKKFSVPQAIALRAIELNLSECPEAASLGLPQRIQVKGLMQWSLDSHN